MSVYVPKGSPLEPKRRIPDKFVTKNAIQEGAVFVWRVPQGEVHEVYLLPTNVLGQWFSLNNDADWFVGQYPEIDATPYWIPATVVGNQYQLISVIDPVTGVVSSTEPFSVFHFQMATEGWIFYEKEEIRSSEAFKVRFRRRFDLEP